MAARMEEQLKAYSRYGVLPVLEDSKELQNLYCPPKPRKAYSYNPYINQASAATTKGTEHQQGPVFTVHTRDSFYPKRPKD